MIATPWGDVALLDDLAAVGGGADGTSPTLSVGSPRERLYAAMTGGCAQRGYDALTITDLVRLSGVSRATFYELFHNKEECFIATLRSMLKRVVAVLGERSSEAGKPEASARAVLTAFIEGVKLQPAAARLCLVEPFSVGGRALDEINLTIERMRVLAQEAIEMMPGRKGLPKELASAIIGGIHQVFYKAVRDGTDLAALEEPLWKWALSYPPPPKPLRLRGRRPKLPPAGSLPPFAVIDPAERIIRGFAAAVAEKGYIATTISDIASHASISQRTFYEYFENKKEVMMAALDSSNMQMAAAVLPAMRRSPGWPDSVREGVTATLRFHAAEPDLAVLRQVEIYAAGPEAIAMRDVLAAQVFGDAWSEGQAPSVDPIAAEAISGALYAVYYQWIRSHGAQSLPELGPLTTYVALAPFLGADRAFEVATTDGRRHVSG